MSAPLADARSSIAPTWRLIVLLGALTTVAPLSIDLYLPSLPTITATFGRGADFAQASMSVYFAGLAIAQFLYGPASDRFGRRMPILAGLALFTAASLAIALTSNGDVLIGGRAAQAVGACAGTVIGRAIVRDHFDHQDTARVLSMLALVAGVAPILAPLAGAGLLEAFGWRSTFFVLAGFGTLVMAGVLLGLPESRSEATALRARSEHPLQAYLALLKQRRLIGYVLIGVLNGAAFFTYVASSPTLLIDIYGVEPVSYGWLVGVNGAGLIAASQLNRRFLRHYAADHILSRALSVTSAFALLVIAAAATGIWGMWGLVVPLFFALSTSALITANSMAGALSIDPLRAGSTSALFGGALFAGGALAAGLAGVLSDGTPLPIAFVIGGAFLGSWAAHRMIRPSRQD